VKTLGRAGTAGVRIPYEQVVRGPEVLRFEAREEPCEVCVARVADGQAPLPLHPACAARLLWPRRR
jgi:hypothetical protein